MKLTVFLGAASAVALFAGAAAAESFEDMCLRVSGEWGSTGDVAAQCSCLAELAAGDQSLADEMTALGESASNDAETYEGASAAGKAAMDQCAVES